MGAVKKKILIAEDDEAIFEVIKGILEGEGYIIIAPRKEQMIHKIVGEELPDLILLDIWLSGQDGGKIAKELKSKQETQSIPVIMMSANNETEKIAQAAGANGFLLKPFTIDELLSIVKTNTNIISH